jgi:hypothetical protein
MSISFCHIFELGLFALASRSKVASRGTGESSCSPVDAFDAGAALRRLPDPDFEPNVLQSMDSQGSVTDDSRLPLSPYSPFA